MWNQCKVKLRSNMSHWPKIPHRYDGQSSNYTFLSLCKIEAALDYTFIPSWWAGYWHYRSLNWFVLESRTCLKTLSPGKLSSAILEHHEFLIEDQTLSEIALLLRDAVPNIFVEVLVSLIKSDIYSLQVSYLKLLT